MHKTGNIWLILVVTDPELLSKWSDIRSLTAAYGKKKLN